MIKKIKKKLRKDINLKELLKGSAITFVLKMTGMLLGYVLVFLISKKTGASGVGFFNIMLQYLTVLGTILTLGMNMAVLRYVGQYHNDENRPKMRLIYNYFLQVVGPLSIIVSIVLFFSSDYLASLLGKDKEYGNGLKLISIILPFFSINQISVEFIRGLKKLQISELVRSIIRPLVMILGLLILRNGNITKIDIIYLMILGLFINSLISRVSIKHFLRPIPKTNTLFDKKEFFDTSISMLISNVIGVLLAAMPIFFLDYFSTEEEVGIFSVVFRLANFVSIILIILKTIAAPKFAELYWSNKHDELQKLILQSTRIMFLSSLAFGILLLFGANFWLSLFGSEFTSGTFPLLILIISQVINAGTGAAGLLMNMTGHQVFMKKISIITLLISTIIYYFLVPEYKMMAVVYILLGQSIFVNVVNCYYTSIKMNLRTFYIPKFFIKK